MSAKGKDARTDRRAFLKFAGLGTVATGAALVTGGQADAEVADAKSAAPGYRETDHVKTFYQTARF
ncbi:twin-arginine translocation signal domain-containing protein [Aurantimonas sp. C2-6-R+9]|uniref:twin-arginine translocation signal domain-containing protein n=1 Tax=unclassified Aurantimonas TaxID=2638230 RepID=UPI002E18FA97|nr:MULTISPECIES: twin-arginine translocation signal domain-containing protein [unclassified Aurantimonas]MEC5289468.1 twin-arginine translocation signal domain-containing protein [Aurantimonas sp. C2-3-R2]MEC5380825.1 twin-arginine translocation signal domain-containing protein [Aurantimonas sp. C2-6-R+9]MEC5410548.1 twin-arginine translocation signal domain-containing protein [Aurantimonas sp. C2-4-R8]